MAKIHQIVGIGEALLDVLGDEQHLGGAPLNLVVHAQRLLARHRGQCDIVSRIGQDRAGELLVGKLKDAGITDTYLQRDPDRPTGRAIATLDDRGEARFDILADAAWDRLQFDPELEDLAQQTDGVAFGTLAQRGGQTRNTIYRFLNECRHAVRLLDVNLREDFDDARILERSCEQASIVKLNEQELDRSVKLLGLTAAPGEGDRVAAAGRALRKKFQLDMVVVTRGAGGTIAFTAAGEHEGQHAGYAPVPNADSIGAGDACAAAILAGRVLRLPVERMLTLANHAGAYVASQPGATAAFPDKVVSVMDA